MGSNPYRYSSNLFLGKSYLSLDCFISVLVFIMAHFNILTHKEAYYNICNIGYADITYIHCCVSNDILLCLKVSIFKDLMQYSSCLEKDKLPFPNFLTTRGLEESE